MPFLEHTTTVTFTGRGDNLTDEFYFRSQTEDAYDPDWFYYYWPYRVLVMYTMDVIAVFGFTAFGVVANVINLLVFYRQGLLADSCIPSLVVLAVSDFVNSVLGFLRTALRCHYSLVYLGSGFFQSVLPWNMFVLAYFVEKVMPLCSHVSCWVTVNIALERMISVVFPFHVKRIFTPKRSYLILLCIGIFCMIFFIPAILAVKLTYIDRGNGTVFYINKLSGLVQMDLYRRFYFVNEVYFRFSLVILMVLFNVVIVLKVNMSSRIRKSTAQANNNPADAGKDGKTAVSHTRKEDKLTRMIVSLCLFYTICSIPGIVIISMLYTRFYGTLTYPVYVDRLLNSSQVLLSCVNGSCNIFFYYAMGTRFKKECRQLWQGTTQVSHKTRES